MYAIVTTGGKQYRVEQGQSLLVERLPVDDGGDATLRPLLYVDGDNVVDGEDLAKVTVQARVVAHERGPKLRVVKFKPKRGYKRRTGHRQELTRIEVTEIKLGSRRPSSRTKPVPADRTGDAESEAAPQTKPSAKPEKAPAARTPRATRASSAGSGEGASSAGSGEGAASAGSGEGASRAGSGDGEAQAKPARGRSAAQPGGDGGEAKPARARRKPTGSKPEEEGNGA